MYSIRFLHFFASFSFCFFFLFFFFFFFSSSVDVLFALPRF